MVLTYKLTCSSFFFDQNDSQQEREFLIWIHFPHLPTIFFYPIFAPGSVSVNVQLHTSIHLVLVQRVSWVSSSTLPSSYFARCLFTLNAFYFNGFVLPVVHLSSMRNTHPFRMSHYITPWMRARTKLWINLNVAWGAPFTIHSSCTLFLYFLPMIFFVLVSFSRISHFHFHWKMQS